MVDYSTQAWCFAVLAWIDCTVGDYASAEGNLQKAEAVETDPFRQTGAGNPFLKLQINLSRALYTAGIGDEASARRHLLQPLNLAIMTSSQPYMTICSALAAILYAHDGRLEPAAELMGLAFEQAHEVTRWMESWVLMKQVRAELEAGLGSVAFEAAWERGKALDLKATTEGVLREIET